MCHEWTHVPPEELINVLQIIGTHTPHRISLLTRKAIAAESINIKACATFTLPPVHPNILQDAQFREDREMRCLKDKHVSLFHL